MSSATQRQANAWNLKLDSLDQWRPDGYDDLNTIDAPQNAQPLIIPAISPYPNYGLPGTGPVVILSYTVPGGMRDFIQKLFIINVGGGLIDGTGNVIWSVLRNGVEAGKGLGQIIQQLGSNIIPYRLEKTIDLIEGDLFQILATVPAGAPIQAGTTGAQIGGFRVPVSRGGF